MNRHFFLVFVVAVISSLFLFPEGVFAQDATALEKEVEKLQTEVQKLQTQSDEYQFLKEQIKDFKDSAKAELQNYRSFVEGEWNKFLLIFLFILGASWWEYRREIQKVKDKAITDFKNRMNKELEEIKDKGFADFKKLSTEEFDKIKQKLFDEWKNEVEKKVKILEELIEIEKRYQDTRILIMGSQKDLDEMKEYMDPAMKKRGVQTPMYLPISINPEKIPVEEIEQALEDTEVIVYYYDPGDKDRDPRMRAIIQLLIEGGREIPFIIYNYRKSRVDDLSSVNKYIWSLFANSPSTLLGHIFTYIHATHKVELTYTQVTTNESRDERASR